MDMTDESKLLLFRLGMEDKILTYFTTKGPFTMRAAPGQIIAFADFSDGEDVNISTNVTWDELAAARNDRDIAKILHMQGENAGEQIMTFLANSGRFEQYIRSRWWYRLFYRTKRIFRKAFALVAFWRYTWVVASWRSVFPPAHLRGGW